MSDLTVKTLGGVTFRSDHGEFRPPTRKAAALLVYLGLSPRGSRSREHLADVLWGRSADEQSRASLRQTLSSLRKALGEQANLLQSDGDAIGIQRDRLEIDALEFEALASSASHADLERAAEVYQGAFLEGFSLKEEGFEDWLAFNRQQYNEIALQLFQRLVEHYRMLQEYETAVRYAQRLLTLDPLQEQTHRLLMELFVRLGRREQALLQFDECERILKKELDVAPVDETRELYASIRSGVALASEHPPGERIDPAQSPASSPSVSTTRAGKPSIAVLPFSNLSGDPAQQYFSDGFSEEVLNGLTRIRSFKIIARNSSFAFRDSTRSAQEIGQQIGARYLVNGSLRRAGNQLRIAVQLVDSETDSQIWSDRYDGMLDEIFDLQDRISAAVIGAIEPKIRASEIEKTRRAVHLGAYELYLKALSLVYEMTRESTNEALSLLNQAIGLDSEFNRALSLAAWCCTLRPTQGWLSRDSDEARQAVEMARRALVGEPDNPEVLWQAGYSIWFFSDALYEGIEYVDRALELNPNSAQAWVASGWARMFSGNPQTAIEHHARAMELSPMDPIGYRPLIGTAAAYVCLGDYARAEQWARKALELGPNYHGCYRVLAASLAYLGRTDEASKVIKKYLELVPHVSIAYYRKHMPWKDVRYREIHEEGLRRAGLPEVSAQFN